MCSASRGILQGTTNWRSLTTVWAARKTQNGKPSCRRKPPERSSWTGRRARKLRTRMLANETKPKRSRGENESAIYGSREEAVAAGVDLGTLDFCCCRRHAEPWCLPHRGPFDSIHQR